ncbi:hypothetical protein NIES4071_47740 [Calothrix sp. NIES-4071]|nr:hypothetical protein NIES4071_47740 [Calothrix sp. NIES-4071]BAZ59086.1 hypothetical protein NIES4105_47680 [Calothrix sp. NIES-4105]
MSNKSNNSRNPIKLFGAIVGGMLIGLPSISVAQAQQTPVNQASSRVNPCPSIFYEEPHNNQVMVPQGCRPNAYTTRMNAQGMPMSNSSVAPTPEQTRLGVGGESPNKSPNNSSYNTQQNYNGTNQSMTQGAVSSSQPLNYPNRGIPNSQIDSTTGNRVNGPAGGYTNLRQSQQNQSYNQSSTMQSQDSSTYSSSNQGIPNSQINSSTGNRVNGPAGGYTNLRNQDTQSNLGGRYQNAVAAVTPTAGRITVRLINKTNAPITFQAVGDTQVRTLAGRSEIALQGLKVPTTVTFYRNDRGLLMVTPRSSESGVLEVSMQETTDFAMDRTALRIENNGSVYLN